MRISTIFYGWLAVWGSKWCPTNETKFCNPYKGNLHFERQTVSSQNLRSLPVNQPEKKYRKPSGVSPSTHPFLKGAKPRFFFLTCWPFVKGLFGLDLWTNCVVYAGNFGEIEQLKMVLYIYIFISSKRVIALVGARWSWVDTLDLWTLIH